MRDDEAFWRALANPTRRGILDLLREGPLTTGDIASRMPDLSRFAVMQHLGLLEEANLIVVRRQGRQRFNHLNPVPLTREYERWVGRFAAATSAEALALERFIHEQEEPTMTTQSTAVARRLTIETEIRVRATADRVWRALTLEQHKWYPYNYGGDRLQEIHCDEFVGGKMYEDWGHGQGIFYGTISYWDPPKTFGLRGHLRGATSTEHWFTIEEDGEECVVKQTAYFFGEISDEEARGIETHGSMKMPAIEQAFRTYVEGS